MENSERLGRQARPEIKPGTSHLPVLSAELLGRWWSESELAMESSISSYFSFETLTILLIYLFLLLVY